MRGASQLPGRKWSIPASDLLSSEAAQDFAYALSQGVDSLQVVYDSDEQARRVRHRGIPYTTLTDAPQKSDRMLFVVSGILVVK